MKEIKPPTLTEIKPLTIQDFGYTPSAVECPHCKAPLLHGPVPCPDGLPGCLVAHYGLKCPNCGRNYQEVAE